MWLTKYGGNVMSTSMWWLSKAEWVWAGNWGQHSKSTLPALFQHLSRPSEVKSVTLNREVRPCQRNLTELCLCHCQTLIHTQMERDRWKGVWCARFDWSKVKNAFYLCLTCDMNVKHGSFCLLCSIYERNLPLKCNCLFTSQDNDQSNGKSFKLIVCKVIQVCLPG